MFNSCRCSWGLFVSSDDEGDDEGDDKEWALLFNPLGGQIVASRSRPELLQTMVVGYGRGGLRPKG